MRWQYCLRSKVTVSDNLTKRPRQELLGRNFVREGKPVRFLPIHPPKGGKTSETCNPCPGFNIQGAFCLNFTIIRTITGKDGLAPFSLTMKIMDN